MCNCDMYVYILHVYFYINIPDFKIFHKLPNTNINTRIHCTLCIVFIAKFCNPGSYSMKKGDLIWHMLKIDQLYQDNEQKMVRKCDGDRTKVLERMEG